MNPRPIAGPELIRGVALALMLAGAAGALQAAELYGTSLNGATGGNPLPSTLYAIDPATGAGTLIGSVGHAINGLAFDPTTGQLYGSTPSWDAVAPNRLLRIDLTTGAGTPVSTATFGLQFVSNLTFNDAGELYAFAHHGDELVRVDKSTGVASVFRDEAVGDGANLLAFDNANVLYLLLGTDLYSVDVDDATLALAYDLTIDPGHHGGFDPQTGRLWSVYTLGFQRDAVISVTDVDADTIELIDTDIDYLHTLAFREGGDSGLLSLSLKASTIAGCRGVSGTVTLGAPAPTGGIEVTLSDTLPAATTPARVRVPVGATQKRFTVKTNAVASPQSGEIRATLGGTTLAQALTLRPMGVASIGLSPSRVTGGAPVAGQVKLECAAGPGPITVELTSTDPSVAVPGVPAVVIPAGVKLFPFVVHTVPVEARKRPKVVGTANDVAASRTLTVQP